MRLEFVRDIKASWGEVPTITVEMEYLGGILSVNRFKYQGRYTRPETKKWMAELAFIIRVTANCAEVRFKPPVKVRIDGVFKNNRSRPDIDNLFKCVNDAVSDGIGLNDKDFINESGVSQIGDPCLTITVSQA